MGFDQISKLVARHMGHLDIGKQQINVSVLYPPVGFLRPVLEKENGNEFEWAYIDKAKV